jgi:hypothetical protein
MLDRTDALAVCSSLHYYSPNGDVREQMTVMFSFILAKRSEKVSRVTGDRKRLRVQGGRAKM